MQTVCVIGAGIVGATVTYELTKHPGVSVSLVDGGYPGAATSSAGTGWVTARGAGDGRYRELRLLAMEEHHRISRELSDGGWLTGGGTLQTEDAGPDFDEIVRSCEESGYPVQVLSAAEVNAALEPDVVFSRPDLRVAHFPTEFTVANGRLTRLLVDRACDRGAVGHFGFRVTGLDRLADDRHRVHLEDGTSLDADVVVNAAGAHADRIAAHYDIPMPMAPQAGVSVRACAPGNPLRRMVVLPGFAAKPEGDGVLRLRSLFGWTTRAGASRTDNDFTGGMSRTEFLDHVTAEAGRLFRSEAPVRALAVHGGVRPIPADGRPRVGEVASVPGYVDAVMHSAGTLAPLVGRLLAEEIATGIRSEVLRHYRPDRFLDPPVDDGARPRPDGHAPTVMAAVAETEEARP